MRNSNVFCVSWSKVKEINVDQEIVTQTCNKVKDYYMIDLNSAIKVINHPQFNILHAFFMYCSELGFRYIMFYDDKSKENQEQYNGDINLKEQANI